PMLDTSVDDLVDKLLRTKNGQFIKDGLPGALLIVTGLTEMAPTDYDLLATTSFLYAALGLFVEDEDKDYAISLYKVGTEYGMRAMKINNSKFCKAMEDGVLVPDAAKYLTKDDLKALTWYGVNLAKRVTLQLDTPEEITDIQDAVATAKRSIELDPQYAWGANWIIMGIFNAIVPAFGGMNTGPEASREAFANGNKAEQGEFGVIDVFVARYLCPLVKDRDWYDQLNNRIMEMDPCKLGNGLCVMNELAKMKAKHNIDHKVKWMGY
ncbi:MAG: TRAP transporter TatT component family protein, partial [Kiritimatiellae bacterium]|nr:TRAP transporter TatT component family protein [Kiritimatiellia bacterium]